MTRFVKADVMERATSYLKIAEVDVTSGDNIKSPKAIDIGVATKRELNGLLQGGQITQKEELEFRIQCRSFLSCTTEKILEKCPLKYHIVRCIRCFDPRVMAGPISTSVKLFERLLHCLIDAKRVKDMEADNLKRQYQQFVCKMIHGSPQTLLKFKDYDMIKDERIDSLLASLLNGKDEFHQLWQLVKCLLVLAHGQAGVERGFSVNSEMMRYNFKERSVVAMRTIYDHIKKCGGVLNVKIDQERRNSARNASSMYRIEQKKRQEEEKEKEKECQNKKVNDEIFALQTKRKRILEDSSQLKQSVDKLMDLAEQERKIVHVTKANSFKRTIKDMELEALELNDRVEELKKKLKH